LAPAPQIFSGPGRYSLAHGPTLLLRTCPASLLALSNVFRPLASCSALLSLDNDCGRDADNGQVLMGYPKSRDGLFRRTSHGD